MFDVYQLMTLVTGVTDLDFKVTEQKKIRHIETETSSILQGAFLTSLEQDFSFFLFLPPVNPPQHHGPHHLHN